MDLLAEISQARYGECGAGELMASRRVQRGRCVLRCVTVALRCVALHRYVKSGFHPGKCHHLRGEGPRALEQSGEQRERSSQRSSGAPALPLEAGGSSPGSRSGSWTWALELLKRMPLGSLGAWVGCGRSSCGILRSSLSLALSLSLSG